MPSPEHPSIEDMMGNPLFELAVLEIAPGLPSYAPENPSYQEGVDKTRRAVLLALEQTGVVHIPANERYAVYDGEERFLGPVAEIIRRKRYKFWNRG